LDEVSSEFRADGFWIHFGVDLVNGFIYAVLSSFDICDKFCRANVSVVIIATGAAHFRRWGGGEILLRSMRGHGATPQWYGRASNWRERGLLWPYVSRASR